MRNSCLSNSNDLPSYDEEKRNLNANWQNETYEIVCKIIGSSLKETDKRESLKLLINKILENIK